MSSTYSTTRDAARDTVRDAARESGIQSDLESLRNDVRRLTDQISDIVTAKGNEAWKRARSNIEGAVSDAASKGQEAVAAVRDVSDNMVEVIEESVQKRPFTTLAIAAGIGFLIGTTWRR
jgi:ElaB/YqjD/DUF883 family membrane-anchored ribosome-binding protein